MSEIEPQAAMEPEWELPLQPDGIVMALRKGGRIRVRPIRAGDADNLIDAYEALSPESRYFRFFSSRPRLSRQMAERLTDIDHRTHFAWLAFDADTEHDGETGDGVGAARLIIDHEPFPEGRSAEAALTVLDAYHHRGIGRFFIELLVSTASEVGVEILRFEVLQENHKMKRLMDGTGASAHAVPGDRTLVEFRLTVPPAETLAVPAGSIYRLLRHVDDQPAFPHD